MKLPLQLAFAAPSKAFTVSPIWTVGVPSPSNTAHSSLFKSGASRNGENPQSLFDAPIPIGYTMLAPMARSQAVGVPPQGYDSSRGAQEFDIGQSLSSHSSAPKTGSISTTIIRTSRSMFASVSNSTGAACANLVCACCIPVARDSINTMSSFSLHASPVLGSPVGLPELSPVLGPLGSPVGFPELSPVLGPLGSPVGLPELSPVLGPLGSPVGLPELSPVLGLLALVPS